MAITATSTPWAPWYVVRPTTNTRPGRWLEGILTHAIAQLHLQLPKLGPDEEAVLEAARHTLDTD